MTEQHQKKNGGPEIHPKHTELFSLFKQALNDVGLTDDEIFMIYHVHLYVTANGKYFCGHRLMIIVYKLVTYIINTLKGKHNATLR